MSFPRTGKRSFQKPVGIQVLILLWRHTVLLTEGLEETGIVPEAKTFIGRCYTLTAGDGVSALSQAFFDDVLVQGDSQSVLEQMRDVVLADVELTCDIIQ